MAATLAIGALAAPATAADPKLAIGHGIPRAKVDVCVRPAGAGQIEAISNFKYGQVVKTSLAAGTYTIIIRAAKGGSCNGAKLLAVEVTLVEDADLSIIATKTRGNVTVLVFDNTDVPAGADSVLSIKHAAMIGRADVYLSLLINDKLPLSAPPTLEGVPKGAAASLDWFSSDVKVGVAKTGKSIVAETPYWEVKDGKVNHVVAVGGPDNARFLRYRTDYDPGP